MLDNGFSMAKVEILNWGNFNGYQKFSLRSERSAGLLFSEPATSAILGVNGSGKSTLIDGIMIALLPFERSLKLGVTNDVETGSSGGRSIKDYVLGKFASAGNQGDIDHSKIYCRHTGCSVFLLAFRHNGNPNKVLNLGRIWWYKEGKVSDNSLYFISHTPIGLMDLTINGTIASSPRAFKEAMAVKHNSFEIFETAESYFTSMSICLGGVKKEDLKLFNRAFYVKSISNIDQFIRENMLSENESTHLQGLLENVQNGNEIAASIKICEDKLKMSEELLKHAEKLQVLLSKRAELLKQQEMLSLFPEWSDLQRLLDEQKTYNSSREKSEAELPAFLIAHEDIARRLENKKTERASSDIHANINAYETQIGALSEKIKNCIMQETQASELLKILAIKPPKKQTDIDVTIEILKEKEELCKLEVEKYGSLELQLQKISDELKNREKKIQEELQFFQKHKTLIRPELYSVKERAIEELKIPASHLMFVGELIQVEQSYQEARRACEAALDPIAKNLLCHPESLEKFTKWLNSFGNKINITVKRINDPELYLASENIRPKNDSILNMISILGEDKNIFYHYLRAWLHSSFDFKIVGTKEFKNGEGRLVTLEGLVRADKKTMRKLSADFRYSLGWNTQERVDEIIQEMHDIQKKQNENKNEFEVLKEQKKTIEKHRTTLIRFEPYSQFDYLLRDQLEGNREKLSNDLAVLKNSNRDYQVLDREIKELEIQSSDAISNKIRCEQVLRIAKERLLILDDEIPRRQKLFESNRICQKILHDCGNINEILVYMTGIFEKVQSGTTYSLQNEYLIESLKSLDKQNLGLRDKVSRGLQMYEQEFHDPNLSYKMPETYGDILGFYKDWQAHCDYLHKTELVQAKDRFRDFFDKILVDSIKCTINDFKSQESEIQKNITSINQVLKLTNYEDLPTQKRYLQIINLPSQDDRVRRFKKKISEVEAVLSSLMRSQIENASGSVMETLKSFVEELQKDTADRFFVTDVRNHFQFHVHSLVRNEVGGIDEVVEKFTGARKDAKSSAQTTQLAYALLASALSYRFKFNDFIGGKNTPRSLILDEFGGKFDNEKPKDIVLLLEKMGFQPILVSPMSKVDLLADRMSHLVVVHKISASESKVQSHTIVTKKEYERVIKEMAGSLL